LEPEVQATPAVTAAVRTADLIVLTMGDLYTSVLPNLLVGGVTQAIADSHARVVAICNRSTKRGETDDFTTADFYRVFSMYLAPAKVDILLVDNGTHPCPSGFQCVAQQALDADVQVIARDFAHHDSPQHISGEKVAAVLNELCTF
jgi:uncharacterized cofD-like protein